MCLPKEQKALITAAFVFLKDAPVNNNAQHTV